jgi:phosphoglucosamine mutase
LEIEAELERPMQSVTSRELGKAHRVTDAAGRYIEFCKSTFSNDLNLRGLKMVVDCANGATYHIAPAVMSELGATVIPLGNKPDGFNINEGCGATCPEALQQAVLAEGADVGIALDGDGDRLIMVDHKGAVVDGDEITFMIARQRYQRGLLKGAVVGTQMSNLGFERAVQTLGLEFKRANVGDRYILEMLQANGWVLGGETSGHIICLDLTTTGDGLISALQVLDAMMRSGNKLSALKAGMMKFPQRLINVRLPVRQDVTNISKIREAVTEAERRLGDVGRVLLRPSGTEPLMRVMVEGQDAIVVDEIAEHLAAVVRDAVNEKLDNENDAGQAA